jgi:hypothetical protein
MDFQLAGSLLATAVAVLYVVEILSQLSLLTRVMRALPVEVRARLPPHPRRPWLAVFGSTRFFLALFRYALRNDPQDPGEIAALKRKMRASAVREALFGVSLAVTVVLLLRHGWQPPWALLLS